MKDWKSDFVLLSQIKISKTKMTDLTCREFIHKYKFENKFKSLKI